jgi:hypothetical protein
MVVVRRGEMKDGSKEGFRDFETRRIPQRRSEGGIEKIESCDTQRGE